MSRTDIYGYLVVLSAVLFFLLSPYPVSCAGPNDYFSSQDAQQVENLVISLFDKSSGSWNKSLKDTWFAVDTLHKLTQSVPNENLICEYAKKALDDKIESIYYYVSITELLKCGERVLDSVVNEIESSLSGDNIYDLVYAVGAATKLKKAGHIEIEGSDLEQAVAAIIDLLDDQYGTWFYEKKNQPDDSSAYFTGLALSALSQLVPYLEHKSELETVFESLPQLLEKADDSDESRLFFRHTDPSVSSLKTTAFLAQGLSDFASSVEVPIGVTDNNMELIAAFLVSQKYVSSLEDAHALVVGLSAVNSGAFKRPLVITLKNTQIHASKEKDRDTDIKVLLTDTWGKPAVSSRVFLVRAYQSGKEDIALLSNQEVPLLQGEKNIYSLDFLAARPDPGSYVLEFRVIPQQKQEQYLHITSAQRRVQVVAAVGLTDGTLSVSDREDKGNEIPFQQGKQLTPDLDLKVHQHLFISFKLRNVVSSRSVSAHQTFVKVTNTITKQTVYYVVPQEAQTYNFHLSISKLGSKVNYVSGLYDIELLIGDSFISSSLRWVLVKAKITFEGKASLTTVEVVDPFAPLPLIEHKFRAPASRAPDYITNIFTVLVLVPIIILVIGFFRIGGNFNNFPTSGLAPIYALLFIGGVGSTLFLIVLYWFSMKLFGALLYVAGLGVPTLFFGNRVLHYYAVQREVKTTKTN